MNAALRAYDSFLLQFGNLMAGGYRTLVNPKAIDRFRPLLVFLEVLLLGVGCAFWLSTQAGVDNFSPETWGEWACILPAELWAGVQMAAGAMIVTGLMHPVTRGRIIAGCVIQCIQFLGLSISAMGSGGQFVIAVYPLVLFIPFHLILALEAWAYEPPRVS
jgi:hypothetical protein